MTDEELTTFCECTPVYDIQYEAENDLSPVVAVVEALATVKEIDPLEMKPLSDVIDIEAVQQLFEGHDNATGVTKTLRFQVDGWNVFIRNDGSIRVCDSDASVPPAPAFERAVGD